MAKITPQEAIQRLKPSPTRGRLMAPSNIQLEYNGTLGDKELLYVIDNKTTSKSYLCPADDQINPVIVEFNGIIDLNKEQPIAIQKLLKQYEDEINYIQSSANDEIEFSTYSPANNISENEKYLIDTEWFQDFPCNSKFPFTNFNLQRYGSRNVHVSAGCVSVAVGQHFYYFYKKFGIIRGHSKVNSQATIKTTITKKDSTGNTISSTTNTVYHQWNLPEVDNIFGDFTEDCHTVYKEFYEEVDNYTGSGSEVSNFLSYLAADFNTRFTRNAKCYESGKVYSISDVGTTSVQNMIRVCSNKWNYKDTSPYSEKVIVVNNKYETICNHLIEKINNGIPSLITFGYTTGFINDNAHTVNCDGYKFVGNDVQFHLNIGWGEKSYNTYYPLRLINPKGKDFEGTHDIILTTLEPKEGIIIGDDTLYGDVDKNKVVDDNDVIAAVKSVYNGQYVKEGDIDKDGIFSENDIEGVYNSYENHNDLSTKINYVYKIKRLTDNIVNTLQDININLKQK